MSAESWQNTTEEPRSSVSYAVDADGYRSWSDSAIFYVQQGDTSSLESLFLGSPFNGTDINARVRIGRCLSRYDFYANTSIAGRTGGTKVGGVEVDVGDTILDIARKVHPLRTDLHEALLRLGAVASH